MGQLYTYSPICCEMIIKRMDSILYTLSSKYIQQPCPSSAWCIKVNWANIIPLQGSDWHYMGGGGGGGREMLTDLSWWLQIRCGSLGTKPSATNMLNWLITLSDGTCHLTHISLYSHSIICVPGRSGFLVLDGFVLSQWWPNIWSI